MPAIFQNPDTTLRDFSRCPYWIEEEYKQWRRGAHFAHVDRWHQISADLAYQNHHFVKSLKKREVETAIADHNRLMRFLPESLRVPVLVQSASANANPKAFVVNLRNGN